MPTSRGLSLVLALVLAASASATFEIVIEDSVLIPSSGSLVFGADFTKLTWRNVTVMDTTVTIENGVSVEIKDSTFENVALKVTMVDAISGVPAIDTNPVFVFEGNSFTYNSNSAFYLTPAFPEFVNFDLNAFAVANPAPAAASFGLRDNDIAVATCGPLTVFHVDNRAAAPPALPFIGLCSDVGLRFDCTPATMALLLTEITEQGIDTCTATSSTTTYGVQQMNNGIYGKPLLTGPLMNIATGADVISCGETCNTYCADDCTAPLDVLSTQVGRYVHVTNAAFDPINNVYVVELDVERYLDDAVTLVMGTSTTDTIGDVLASGVCMSRTLGSTLSTIHDSPATRFDDSGPEWVRTSTIGVNNITHLSEVIQVEHYRIQLTTSELIACSGAAEIDTINFHVRAIHTEKLAVQGGTVHIVGDNIRDFSVFLYANYIAVVQNAQTSEIRLLEVFARPADLTVAEDAVEFPVEFCVATGGQDVAMRFTGQTTSETTTVGNLGGPSCDVITTLELDGSVCNAQIAWSIQPSCMLAAENPTLPTATHCCQIATALTAQRFNDVAVSVPVGLELYDNAGTGNKVEPDRAITLTFEFISDAPFAGITASGTSIGVGSYALRTEMDPRIDDSAFLEDDFVVGQEILYKLKIEGLDYSLYPFGTFGLETTHMTQCSNRDQLKTRIPFDASNPLSTGCNYVIPNEVDQRSDPIYASLHAGPRCDSPQTGTTAFKFVCYPNAELKFHSNQHILGRCSESREMCRTLEAPHLPTNLLGASECTASPTDLCFQSDNDNWSVNEIPNLKPEWTNNFCSVVGDPNDLQVCDNNEQLPVGSNIFPGRAHCADPSRCVRDITQVIVRHTAQLHTYGQTQTPAPIETDFQGVIYVAKLMPTLFTRRLLSIEEERGPGALRSPAVRRWRKAVAPNGQKTHKQRVSTSSVIHTRCPPQLVACGVTSTCETAEVCDSLREEAGLVGDSVVDEISLEVDESSEGGNGDDDDSSSSSKGKGKGKGKGKNKDDDDSSSSSSSKGKGKDDDDSSSSSKGKGKDDDDSSSSSSSKGKGKGKGKGKKSALRSASNDRSVNVAVSFPRKQQMTSRRVKVQTIQSLRTIASSIKASIQKRGDSLPAASAFASTNEKTKDNYANKTTVEVIGTISVLSAAAAIAIAVAALLITYRHRVRSARRGNGAGGDSPTTPLASE